MLENVVILTILGVVMLVDFEGVAQIQAQIWYNS